jgi:hypothetical protein
MEPWYSPSIWPGCKRVELEEAITYHAKHWSHGRWASSCAVSGGYQRNGERSRIATKRSLAIKGSGARRGTDMRPA